MPNKTNNKHIGSHSFIVNPHFRFENQFDDENLILILRAHPITQIPWIFNTIVFIILLIISNFFLPAFLSARQILFTDIFLSFAIISYFWINFLSWFFNVGIVTNKRIIDIDYHAIIYKDVSEAKLEKIEEINVKSGGALATVINYGNIFIQTAGEEINIEFINVPHPSDAVQIINGILGKK